MAFLTFVLRRKNAIFLSRSFHCIFTSDLKTGNAFFMHYFHAVFIQLFHAVFIQSAEATGLSACRGRAPLLRYYPY